jgi:hypothetical protein
MEEEEENSDRNEGDLNYSALTQDEIMKIFEGTEGFDPALIEELMSTGNFEEFIQTLDVPSPTEEADGDRDGAVSATGTDVVELTVKREPTPIVPSPTSSVSNKTIEKEIQLQDPAGDNSIMVQCVEIEVKTEESLPIEYNSITVAETKPESGASQVEIDVKHKPTETETPPAQTSTACIKSESKELPNQNHSQSPPTSPSVMKQEDKYDLTKSQNHEKKKKDKHRKHSTDSADSIKRHKSKHKHKEKERAEKERKRKDSLHLKEANDFKVKTHPFYKQYRRYDLKYAKVVAIDINEIVLLKKHMVLRREKVCKIEEIDKEKREQFRKKRGYEEAVFSDTKEIEKEKNHSHERRTSISKPDRDRGTSSKRKDEDKKFKKEQTKKKRVFCVSDDSDSDKEKSKHKKGQHSHKTEKEKEREKKHKELYSATGARILPFEKRHKEQERIRRPKMLEPEPTMFKKEDEKGQGNSDQRIKIMEMLKKAQAEKDAKARQAATQFR